MSWNSKSKARRVALKYGYRSGFEHKVSDQLKEQKIEFGYEDTTIEYIIPERKSKYTVDFTLPNGILVETKGRLTLQDRQKMIFVKKQHPVLDIRLVFQSANAKLSKGSKTTYAQWAEKNGFKWAEKFIPESWLAEKKV